jgi:hypothetical protein
MKVLNRLGIVFSQPQIILKKSFQYRNHEQQHL